MLEAPSLALTHVDTRDFLRGVHVTTFEGLHAAELIRDIFMNHQVQQAAFVALADCGLTLVPIEGATP